LFWVNAHCHIFCFWSLAQWKVNCKVELVPSPLSATEVSSAIRYTSEPPDSFCWIWYMCLNTIIAVCVCCCESLYSDLMYTYALPSSSVHKLRLQDTGSRESRNFRNHEVQQPHVFWFFFWAPPFLPLSLRHAPPQLTDGTRKTKILNHNCLGGPAQ
jgi:hypothetical protein